MTSTTIARTITTNYDLLAQAVVAEAETATREAVLEADALEAEVLAWVGDHESLHATSDCGVEVEVERIGLAVKVIFTLEDDGEQLSEAPLNDETPDWTTELCEALSVAHSAAHDVYGW